MMKSDDRLQINLFISYENCVLGLEYLTTLDELGLFWFEFVEKSGG